MTHRETQETKKRIPLMFVGDHPSMKSGLARIVRDLATRLATDDLTKDVFRVAVLGKGGYGQLRSLPFPCYSIPELPNTEWGQSGALKLAWEDWSGGERGAIMTVWDASRLLWLARPEYSGNAALTEWLHLTRAETELWGYFPIDATGPNDRISAMSADTMRGFDRVLCYTEWAARLTDNTLQYTPIERTAEHTLYRINKGVPQTPHLPHGLDLSTFHPRDRDEARLRLGIPRNAFLVGVVATNQARKDWGLVFEVCAKLKQHIPNLYLWAHTDVLERYWSLNALTVDFDLTGRVLITGVDDAAQWDDERLAWAYAACDVTLAPGLGEGFGYPIVESLACGVPVVHGDYGGGAEFVPKPWLMTPHTYRLEGLHDCIRPVFCADDWVNVIKGRAHYFDAAHYRREVEHLDWNSLWPRWRDWFLSGAASLQRPTDPLARVRALNFSHHERMTREHNSTDPEANERIRQANDAAYRSLLAEVPKGGSVLELGSAHGGAWRVLGEWGHLTGVDLYEPAVKESQAQGLDIHLGYVEALPFPDASFDIVCSQHVMEHVSDPKKALAEVYRVLKPGGWVAAITPHYFPDPEPAHICQQTVTGWAELYRHAGFKVKSLAVRKFACVECHVVGRKPLVGEAL